MARIAATPAISGAIIFYAWAAKDAEVLALIGKTGYLKVVSVGQ